MKRLVLSLCFIFLVTPALSVSAVAPSEPGAKEVFWDALGAVVLPSCTVACHHNSCNEEDEHSSSSTTPGVQQYDDGTHGCKDTGLCEYAGGSKHPDCFEVLPAPEAELVAEAAELLDAAIASGDTAMVVRIVRTAPTVFQVNAGRKAIQVMGCAQLVASQYPVPTEIAGELLEFPQ